MIALALMQANCAQYDDAGGAWLDLTQGFFLPVDEIADLAPVSGLPDPGEGLEGGRRADFIHVRAPPRGGAGVSICRGEISIAPEDRPPARSVARGSETNRRSASSLERLFLRSRPQASGTSTSPGPTRTNSALLRRARLASQIICGGRGSLDARDRPVASEGGIPAR